jgi:hypothetical protein
MEPKNVSPFHAREGVRMFIMKPHSGPVPPDAGPGEAFAAGQVAGHGPDRVFIGFGAKGTHAFSTFDGTWLEGPHLDYADYVCLPPAPEMPMPDRGMTDLARAGQGRLNGARELR